MINRNHRMSIKSYRPNTNSIEMNSHRIVWKIVARRQWQSRYISEYPLPSTVFPLTLVGLLMTAFVSKIIFQEFICFDVLFYTHFIFKYIGVIFSPFFSIVKTIPTFGCHLFLFYFWSLLSFILYIFLVVNKNMKR